MPAARAILAEDEPLLREELAELLARLWPELAIVAQTADGIATLQALEKHGPDILFLDINMPGMSGYAVAREIRERRGPLAPLLIAISGAWKDNAEQRVARDLGFDHYLRKPCEAGELVALLDAFRRHARGEASGGK